MSALFCTLLLPLKVVASPLPKTQASASGIVITITVDISRRDNFCISSGSGCNIHGTITIGKTKKAIAVFDKIGSEYDGQTMDGFTFETSENGEIVTYDVPTQVLHWDSSYGGFLL